MATEKISTSIIADDAVTGAKIENNPTVAGNLSVGGTAAVTGTSTFTGASTFSGGIANAGTITAGTIGSAVTGFAGAKEVDFWRLNADNSEANLTIMNSTLERVDDTSEKIGTGMTKDGSGIFSFPSTGKYIIKTIALFLSSSGGQQYGGLHLEVTVNNSAYTDYCNSYADSAGTNYYGTASAFYFLDVTDKDQIKVRFKKVVSHATNYVLQGHSSIVRTGMLFMRIGDT